MEVPADFLKRENRCGFDVSEMMKRAWAAEMEVLEVIDMICRKHQLQYFADWGTLLGAIRHKGYIPWDDDIDICLKRKDYNQLIQILPQELPQGFVLAGMYATSSRLREAAYVPQLRVIADETQWNFNEYMQRFHGFPYQRIGIDIFPLDNMPENMELSDLQRIMIRQGMLILGNWNQLEAAGELNEVLMKFEQFCGVKIPKKADIKNWLWKLIDTICALYEGEDATNITYFATCVVNPCYKKEWYEEAIFVPFEYMQIPVPIEYDKVLKVQFGDYMVPKRICGGHDYPFYGAMEEELEKQVRAVGFHGSVEEFCEMVSTGKLYV